MLIHNCNTENKHISYLLFSYPFPTKGTTGHLKCHSVFSALCTNCQRQLMVTVSQGFISKQQDCKTLPQLCSLTVLSWQFLFVCHYQLFTLLVSWKKTAHSPQRSLTKLVSWRSTSQKRYIKPRSKCRLHLEEAKGFSVNAFQVMTILSVEISVFLVLLWTKQETTSSLSLETIRQRRSIWLCMQPGCSLGISLVFYIWLFRPKINLFN